MKMLCRFPLMNRPAVIPFENVMNNAESTVSAYEDVYFEIECDAIVSKALKAFHKVLARSDNISNLQFSDEYSLNGCIETKMLAELCELIDEINPTVTAEFAIISNIVKAVGFIFAQGNDKFKEMFTLKGIVFFRKGAFFY